MKVYDALTRKKRDFVPIKPGTVAMYVCGITPHDHGHLGHALAAVRFNMVRNYLEFAGHSVTFVQNVTDVDDKIIARAQAENCLPNEIAVRYTTEYNGALRALGVRPPTHEPKVSEYIPQIVTYVQELIARGVGYVTETGDVYFDLNKKPDYGKLSGRRIEELLEGTRKEVRQEKRNPLDFALWKRDETPGASWDSPWGKGRPGWHIECSVMSNSLLGPHIDIHGGGLDLIFPHHENELAQCEAHNDGPFVNHWLHSGLLNVDGEKMSKSLGNYITIADGLERYGSELFVFVSMKSHYRSAVNLSDELFRDSLNSLCDYYWAFTEAGLGEEQPATSNSVESEFRSAMDNDFNTPLALVALAHALKSAQKLLKDRNNPQSRDEARGLLSEIRRCGRAMGLFRPGLTSQEVIDECLQFQSVSLGREVATSRDISELLAQRAQAREQSDFKKSDEVRDKLLAMGVNVLDMGTAGTTWRFAVKEK